MPIRSMAIQRKQCAKLCIERLHHLQLVTGDDLMRIRDTAVYIGLLSRKLRRSSHRVQRCQRRKVRFVEFTRAVDIQVMHQRTRIWIVFQPDNMTDLMDPCGDSLIIGQSLAGIRVDCNPTTEIQPIRELSAGDHKTVLENAFCGAFYSNGARGRFFVVEGDIKYASQNRKADETDQSF
jgi:hypothetical protein